MFTKLFHKQNLHSKLVSLQHTLIIMYFTI